MIRFRKGLAAAKKKHGIKTLNHCSGHASCNNGGCGHLNSGGKKK